MLYQRTIPDSLIRRRVSSVELVLVLSMVVDVLRNRVYQISEGDMQTCRSVNLNLAYQVDLVNLLIELPCASYIGNTYKMGMQL